jgi:hypothetical protein
MRKTIFTALVTLLVMLAVVSCDSSLTGENGDGLVTLSVNTGDIAGISRSITDTQAKKEANFVEVIFEGSDSVYYRAAGYQGAKLKVKVPAGTYDNTNTLILIGKKGDGTLLAFGTATNAVTVGGANPSDPTINLTATSIETKISAAAGTNFVITTTNINAVNTAFTTEINNGILFDDDATSSCFQVPTGVIAATYTDGIKVTLGLTTANFSVLGDRIIVQASSTPVKFTPITGDSPAINPITGSVKPVAAGDFSSGAIEFAFNTTTDEGKYSITFDFPVVGYDNTVVVGTGTEPLTWHIRGGTEPGYDFGGTKDAINDTVPLRVTATLSKAKFGIIANPGH